nr:putative reverse transcriptase domain-containing protein [Tanacetum cinerariifolium]
MESKLWNLKVKDYDMTAYTACFNKLVLLCPEMVLTEKKKIGTYICGLFDNIKGKVTSSSPTTMNAVVRMAHTLIEQKRLTKAERDAEGNKRRWESSQGGNKNNRNNYRDNTHHHQQNNSRYGNARVMTTGPAEQVGMDWLVECDAVIVCGKKEVRVPYKNKTLVVKGDRGPSRLKVISCIKARKYVERGCQLFLAQVMEKEPTENRLQDVPVIHDFLEVFPDDFPGCHTPNGAWTKTRVLGRVDEGTGSKLEVPDVLTDESEEELSWNSTNDKGDDNEEQDEGDDGEEGNGDDDDADQEVVRDDDKDNDEEGGDDEHESDKETKEEKSFDPIPQTPKDSEDEGDGEEDLSINIVKVSVQIQSDRLREEAQRENDEFLRTVDENIKKIFKEQVKEQVKAQVSKILTRIEQAVNKKLEAEVLTQSSYSSRTSYAALVDAYESDKIILDTYGETVTLKRRHDDDEDKDEEPSARPDRGSKRRREGKEPESVSALSKTATRSTGRLRSLEENFSEVMQTNQFADAVFAVPGIVQHYMDQRMNEAVKVSVQIQSDRLREEAQRENDEFLRTVDENIKKIFKEQVKEQVKAQVSKILTRIEQAVNKKLEAEVLTQSSYSSRTSYAVAADLSEMELKKILIEKMEGNKVDTLTPVGPTYELMKGSCKSLTELEYHLEEVYKATTDQLDWVNPKGQQYPHNLLQPLPLIPENRGRYVIPFEHFINNELEYLHGGASSCKYTTSVTKTKATDYGHIKWIEDLGRKRQQFYSFTINREYARDVYSKRRIIAVTELKIVEWHSYKHLDWITVRRDVDKLYKFKEGDFKRLRIQDIEDMLLLLVQGKLTNLTVEERFGFNVSLQMFTRSIVIQRHVEDLQLGVESYQKRLNLTKPDTYISDLKRKEAYTAYSNPRGFIYQNKNKKNRLMRIDELHKFSDGTLTDVRTALDDRLKGIQIRYLPQTIWRKSDKGRAVAMI